MQPSRNDPCQCGSGKKYKHCHERQRRAAAGKIVSLSLPVMSAAPQPKQVKIQRGCDGCSECCGPALLINDPDLVLPTGKSCRHRCAGGCAIHGEGMPETCSSYICNYLVEPGRLTVEDRPDHMGAIVRLARDRSMPESMQRSTYVNESQPGGLERVLANRVWGDIIRRDLRAGYPVIFSMIEDLEGKEVLIVRYKDGRLGCDLTSCRADGAAVLVHVEPVYETPLQIALVIPNQGFVFDADLLLDLLGDKEQVVIGPSSQAKVTSELRFLFTRRQAEVLRMLQAAISAKSVATIGA